MNEIGIYAFSKCTSLNKDITIPTSITNIGTKAFAQSGITGITIPKILTWANLPSITVQIYIE